MINREATIRWKGYDPSELSYGSSKRVWANCDDCGDGRWVSMDGYNDLCRSCGLKKYYKENPDAIKRKSDDRKKLYEDPKERKNLSDIMKKVCEDPKVRKRMSDTMKKVHKDDPTLSKRLSDSQKESYRNDSSRSEKHSNWLKNSDMVKFEAERQRGGHDIVQHHYLYDHSDLSKNTVGITRSDHMKLHRLLQKLKYMVPHINGGL